MDRQVVHTRKSGQGAKASYDRLSRWYDLLAERSEDGLRRVGLQMLAAQQGEVILEIGCGTGHALVALARSVGNSGRVYGVDISEGMLAVAEARVRGARAAPQVELRCADAAQLPFEANSCDAIFMSFTLELFDALETPLVLSECKRVLRGGGRLCVVAMSRRGKPNLMTRLYEWAHRILPSFVDCRPILVPQTLSEAGFRIGKVAELSIWGLPVDVALAGRA